MKRLSLIVLTLGLIGCGNYTLNPIPQQKIQMPRITAQSTIVEDISTIERTNVDGQIFDNYHTPLSGIQLQLKSLNSSIPYEKNITTEAPFYSFTDAPAGVALEIIAHKEGYFNHRRVEILQTNREGDPRVNHFELFLAKKSSR